MSPEIALAHDLFARYQPEATTLEIQEYKSRCNYSVVMRLTYTSKRSGRTMSVMAKRSQLPFADDEVLRFFRTQLVLQPREIALEFSRLAFLEKRAKQEAWLAMGKSSRLADGTGDIIQLNSAEDRADSLPAIEYSPEAAFDQQHDNLTLQKGVAIA